MKLIKIHSRGKDVVKWKVFLRGFSTNSRIVINNTFDYVTLNETKSFQDAVGFSEPDCDGVVGRKTYAAAMTEGFNSKIKDNRSGAGPNWPKKPFLLRSMSQRKRRKMFGAFKFIAAPRKSNPEAIKITDSWAKKNIIKVHIPQLKYVQNAPSSCNIYFNSKAAPQLVSFFKELEEKDLLKHVLTWNGSYVPRYVRGSRKTLSNHSWGTAFDINVPWNRLGTVPALKGREGSVREFVHIATKHGFFWGGFYKNRKDGMHFEVSRLV